MSRYSLDNVFCALTNSVLEAQKLTEQQHQRQIRRYFKISNTDKDQEPQYDEKEEGQPKTQKFRVPDLRPETDTDWREIELPILALSPPTSIKIKELTINFKVSMSGLGPDKKGVDPVSGKTKEHGGEMNLDMGGDLGEDAATVDVTFDQAVTPDAYHRLAELLSKKIPW